MQRRERRYAPSPHRAHSKETIAYRDHWDLGWRHLGTLAGSLILSFEADLRGASRHGYRDGLLAKYEYLQRAKQTDPEILRREREELLAAQRAAGADDRPY